MHHMLLFAEAPQGQGAGELPFFMNPMFLMLMMGLFFVVIVLPQGRRQRREQEQLLAGLKPGTKVLTAAGIIGIVVTVKDGEDEITLRSADSKFKVLKSSVTRVLGEETTDGK